MMTDWYEQHMEHMAQEEAKIRAEIDAAQAEQARQWALIENGQCPTCESHNVRETGYGGAEGTDAYGRLQEASWIDFTCDGCGAEWVVPD